MPTPLRIDFVSDIACPWCAVGLNALERALAELQGEVVAEIHFQPFELNPQLGPEGEDADTHLAKKYGLAPAQLERNRAVLRERGAEVGFTFNRRERIVNTFDAHRLLHWAAGEGRQRDLKHALLRAYFTEGEDVSRAEVLLRVVQAVGLDAARAQAILASDEFAEAVRAQEAYFQTRGIQAVPAVIVNQRHLIQGGQPVEVFAQALRQIAAEQPAVALH